MTQCLSSVRRFRARNSLCAVALVGMGALVAGCGSDDPSEAGGATFRTGISEPVSIDPYNSQESSGQLVTKLVFEGLVTLDEDGVLQSGAAERWEHDETCSTWVFTLRPDAAFSTGEPVVASSFVDGWTRAANDEAASDVATYMQAVVGFDDLHGTEDTSATTETLAGLSAPDQRTLRVELATSDCEFDKRTLHPVFSPVPPQAGTFDNKVFNDLPIGNGPYKLAEPWRHDESITLIRNEHYAGPEPALERIELTIGSVDDGYKRFQAGAADLANVPSELVAQAKDRYGEDGAFISLVGSGITYLSVHPVNPPLDQAAARRALSAAIDRQAIIDGVFKAPMVAADSIVTPAFPRFYAPGACEACRFDPDQAKAWAKEGGLEPGSQLDLSFNEDGGNRAFVEAIGQQIEQTLGVDVRVVAIPQFSQYLAAQQDPGARGLFRMAWAPDYPSPMNQIEPLAATTGAANLVGYSNPDVDARLTAAAAATSEADQVDEVRAAERLALDDMAIIPLWYQTSFYVFDVERWTGLGIDFFGNPTLTKVRPVDG